MPGSATVTSRAAVAASRRLAIGPVLCRCFSSASPARHDTLGAATVPVTVGASSPSPSPRALLSPPQPLLQSARPPPQSSTSPPPPPPPPPPPLLLLSRARPSPLTSSLSSASRPPFARAFRSYDHPPDTRDGNPFTSTAERAILAAALRRVPDHGFSADALALGARDAGLLDISASLLPDGPFSLVRWHLVEQREALAARARVLFSAGGSDGGTSTPSLSVADKVEALTWERLRANAPVIHRWQEALAIMAQPSYAAAALRELAMLSDEIWFLAGDAAVDPTWYAKRASLSAMYAAADLFMTNDGSPGFADTRDFLRRRLAEARLVGDGAGAVAQWLGFTAGAAVNVLRSKGVPI